MQIILDKIVKTRLLHLLLLVIVSIILYGGVLRHGLFGFDSVDWHANFFKNDTGKITLSSVKKILIPQKENSPGYYPVFSLYILSAYLISESISPGNITPSVFNLFNVLTHIMVVLLYYILVFNLTQKTSVSFLAALIFAVHPCHTEPINWQGAAVHLLVAFFALTSFYFYVKYSKGRRNSHYFASLAAFIFANMSKSSIVLFPLLLLFYEIYLCRPVERYGKRFKIMISRLLPFFLVAFVFVLIPLFLFPEEATAYGPVYKVYGLKIIYKYPALLLKYLANSILPLRGDLLGSTYQPETFNAYYFTMLIVVFILLLIIYFIILKKKKYVLLGLVWFTVFLLPGTFIVRWFSPFSLRLLYGPSAGIYMAGAILFIDLLNKMKKYSRIKVYLSALIVFYVVGLGYISYSKNKLWKSTEILWGSVAKNYPDCILFFDNPRPEYNDKKLIEVYEKKISLLKPSKYNYPEFYSVCVSRYYAPLADLYVKLHYPEEKIKNFFYEWYEQDHRNIAPLNKLGEFYEARGEYKKARIVYEKAVKKRPKSDYTRKKLKDLTDKLGSQNIKKQ